MNRKNLELASLLHDIGKFYQRTGLKHSDDYNNLSGDNYGQNGAHGKWSSDFIKKYWNSTIADLALYHHAPNNSKTNVDFAKIIQKADHHSSSERISDEKNPNVNNTSLISVFSDIFENEVSNKYIPLRKIDLNYHFNEIIPNVKEDNLKYTQLWNEFEKEIASLNNPFDFNTILALLHKYTSTMPSAAYVSKPDISLFDHLKTTSALAICRYLYEKNSKKNISKEEVYLTINGDISGIQSFIFKISSPQEAQSGMSKRLRGRSLYLTLLSDAIASRILEDLKLTKANLLFCGGGRFTIIAPNTEETINKLNDIKNTVNKEFISKFNAELYLAIAYETTSGKDLEKFGNITRTLSNKLVEEKKHKFINQLDDVFKEDIVKHDDICSVCGNLYEKKDENFRCSECKSHEDLGKKVANAKYMIKCYLNEDIKDKKISFKNLNIAYIFEENIKEIKKDINKFNEVTNHFEIIKLNNTNFLELENEFSQDELDKISFSYSFLANIVPKLPNSHPLYFEHLAKISKGANKLGILKMDVDDLGLIFSKGLKNSSISRVSTLSSQLDLFFSGIINEIAKEYVVYNNIGDLDKDLFKEITLEDEDKTYTVYKSKEKFNQLKEYEIPTIHINYSGGDDLLVLGPYDDIIDFSQNLRNKFKSWTCNNPAINLSGGISIVSAKFPIGKGVDLTEEYLEVSKSCGKDKITVFGEVVNWEDDGTSKTKGFNNLFDFALKLEKYNENKDVSTGFIFSLLKMWEGAFKNTKTIPQNKDEYETLNLDKIKTKRFIPLFKYKLRLIKNKEIQKELNENTIKFMPWIKIPVSWVSLRMR